MKSIARILTILLCCIPVVRGYADPVATTNGSNLTSFNPSNAGNNQWATMTNGRDSANGGGATADFGNCNSLILRCAQPKCANGGCTDMNVAGAIVMGCVTANKTCEKYGNDLISYMAAQLVANSTAKANAASSQQALAAAEMAQQQSQQQMAQMQQQMMMMQQQMADQAAASTRQMAEMQESMQRQNQQAIDNLAAAAAANAQQQTTTVSQEQAISNGVSTEVLLREQIAPKIETKIKDAELSLKALKEVMYNTFEYAGCDRLGNNCTGPKRVKRFKEYAMGFFEPYEEVADKLYEALETAMMVGVDVSDVLMLMNGSCNRWAKYVCGSIGGSAYEPVQYKSIDESNGEAPCSGSGKSLKGTRTRGGASCVPGQLVEAPDDAWCTFTTLVDSDTEDLVDIMLYPDTDSSSKTTTRLGCMSDAIGNMMGISRRAKKSASTIDLDTFERMITQDGSNMPRGALAENGVRSQYCVADDVAIADLQKWTKNKTLPKPKEMCINESELSKYIEKQASGDEDACSEECKNMKEEFKKNCYNACYACTVVWDGTWHKPQELNEDIAKADICTCKKIGGEQPVFEILNNNTFKCKYSKETCKDNLHANYENDECKLEEKSKCLATWGFWKYDNGSQKYKCDKSDPYTISQCSAIWGTGVYTNHLYKNEDKDTGEITFVCTGLEQACIDIGGKIEEGKCELPKEETDTKKMTKKFAIDGLLEKKGGKL